MGGRGGSALRGDLWQTPKASEEESGSGLNGRGEPKLKAQANQWRTPTSTEHQNDRKNDAAMEREANRDGAQVTVAMQARMWATPNAHDGRRPGADMKSTQGANLNRDAVAWPTPRSTDGTKGGPNQAGSKGDLMLPSAAAQWPTPSASVANDGESPQTWHARAAKLKEKHGNGNGAGMPLTVASVSWPTPTVRDHKGGGTAVTRPDGKSRMDMLDWRAEAFSRQAQQTQPGQESSPPSPTSPRRLNPIFGGWLMGWPLTWAIAEPSSSSASATVLYRLRLQQHLSCLLGEPASSPTDPQQQNP